MHLEELVAPDRVPAIVDVLRTLTNGITLSSVEHPDEWPPERQFTVIDDVLASYDLLPEASRRRTDAPRRKSSARDRANSTAASSRSK
jgi:hypothetical protein